MPRLIARGTPVLLLLSLECCDGFKSEIVNKTGERLKLDMLIKHSNHHVVGNLASNANLLLRKDSSEIQLIVYTIDGDQTCKLGNRQISGLSHINAYGRMEVDLVRC